MEPTTGKTLVTNDRFHQWLEETPPIVTFKSEGYDAVILPGSPDEAYGTSDSATLYWHDGVCNDWAESYSSVPTAIARLAALEQGASTGKFFRDGPEGFTRWSDQFFERTILDSIIPATKEAP